MFTLEESTRWDDFTSSFEQQAFPGCTVRGEESLCCWEALSWRVRSCLNETCCLKGFHGRCQNVQSYLFDDGRSSLWRNFLVFQLWHNKQRLINKQSRIFLWNLSWLDEWSRCRLILSTCDSGAAHTLSTAPTLPVTAQVCEAGIHVFGIIFKNPQVGNFVPNSNWIRTTRRKLQLRVCSVFQIVCWKEDKRKRNIPLIVASHVLTECVH